jgi:hypothetical protein
MRKKHIKLTHSSGRGLAVGALRFSTIISLANFQNIVLIISLSHCCLSVYTEIKKKKIKIKSGPIFLFVLGVNTQSFPRIVPYCFTKNILVIKKTKNLIFYIPRTVKLCQAKTKHKTPNGYPIWGDLYPIWGVQTDILSGRIHIENGRQGAIKLHIDHSADNL